MAREVGSEAGRTFRAFGAMTGATRLRPLEDHGKRRRWYLGAAVRYRRPSWLRARANPPLLITGTTRQWLVDRASGAAASLRGASVSACGGGNMSGLVISGGRVDPATGMGAVGDVTVVDAKIAAIGAGLDGAERVIDASGLHSAKARSEQ
jgi:hypothetical protein